VKANQATAALEALADPTRRAVLELVRTGERPVGEIAARLPVSRPAVSQHLRVLKEAGLVSERQDGTRHLYRIDPAGLLAVREFLERYWDAALTAFADAAEASEEAGALERTAAQRKPTLRKPALRKPARKANAERKSTR
jgi:DNA-binding transcriptional ArsR family regulator